MTQSRPEEDERISIADIDRATEQGHTTSSGGNVSSYTGRVTRDSSTLFGRHHYCGPNCKTPCEMPLYPSREAFLAGIKSVPEVVDAGLNIPVLPADTTENSITLSKLSYFPGYTILPVDPGSDEGDSNSLLQGYIGLNQALQNEINVLKKQNRALRDERLAAVASQEHVKNQLQQLKSLINSIVT